MTGQKMREKPEFFFKWAAVLMLSALAALLYARYPGNPESYRRERPSDFAVYLKAWERAKLGQTPYVATDPSPYKYSPGILTAVSLLPEFPPQAWYAFSVFCILSWILALAVGARYTSMVPLLGLCVGTLLAWKGVLETLDYGQLEILLFALAIVSGALVGKLPFFSGLLAGTLPWIKLPWLLLLLPLLLRRRELNRQTGYGERGLRLLVSGYVLSCFLWGIALPSLTWGADRSLLFTQQWFELLKTQPLALYLSDMNQSLWVSTLRWFPGWAWQVSWGVLGILLSWILARLIRRTLSARPKGDVMDWMCGWILLTQLVNPLSWRWGSAVLVAAGFPLVAARKESRRWLYVLTLAVLLGLFLIQLNPVVQALGYVHWTELHRAGTITAYWLVLLAFSLL